MVAKPSRDSKKQHITQPLTAEQFAAFFKWLRTLQKALTLEAENGFGNIRGRADYFHTFVVKEILNPPITLKENVSARFSDFSKCFKDYPHSEKSKRRRLVIDIRKALHELNKEYSPECEVKPTKLRV